MNNKDPNSANTVWAIFILLLLMGVIISAWERYYDEGNLLGMLFFGFIGAMLIAAFVIEFIIKKLMKRM